MFDSLPTDATGTLEWPWEKFEAYYEDLHGRSLTAETIEDFLTDWSRLSELLDETYSRLYTATTVNTADEKARQGYYEFLDSIFPASAQAEQRLKEKFLATELEPEGMEIARKRMRTEVEIFRRENLPLISREQKLGTEYSEIVGAQTVTWEGKELTIAQLRPLLQKQDRALREKVWRLARNRQLEDKERIDGLWKQFMTLRLDMASNAGFEDYRSFRWKQLERFDYTPEQCKEFHHAIEEVVVPASTRISEKRRNRLGFESLRPWDLEVDPLGRPPLEPFADVGEMKSKASAMFHRVDPQLGEYFDIMVRENLLDLDNRKNKAPGGYCTDFAAVKKPFVFMNAVGIHDDVQTLLHESGHCFHVFERTGLPYYPQRHVGMEFSEVASMAMELLAAPYLPEALGGFYSEADAGRARVEHLERSIQFWPYMALVDAFQHWIYENHEEASDPDACDRQWLTLCDRFTGGVDWSDLEEERKTIWRRQLHIFEVPFYYVEYGMAQLGAVQVWANALQDQARAVEAYRRSLALGGTSPLPELFSAAGARFAFDADTLKSCIGLMERTIEELEEGAASSSSP